MHLKEHFLKNHFLKNGILLIEKTGITISLLKILWYLYSKWIVKFKGPLFDIKELFQRDLISLVPHFFLYTM